MKEQYLRNVHHADAAPVPRAGCSACTLEGASVPHSGIDLSNIDHSVRPQDDLYQHVNGAWLKSTTIPDDRPLEGTFTALRDGSELAVRDDHRGSRRPRRGSHRHRAEGRGPLQQLHGRSRVEAKGMDPIRARLAEVFATKSVPNSSPWPGGCSAPTSARALLHLRRPPTPATRTGSCSTPARAAWACRMSRTTARRSSRRWSQAYQDHVADAC